MTARDKAKKWLNAKNLDLKSKTEIETLLESEDELKEAFQIDLEFGTGGLRGIMGTGSNRLNKYTIGMATQGFANYLKKSNTGELKVAIAHDSRNNSRFFAKTTANVFAANGIKVFLFEDLRPTPELSFAIRDLKCQGGVVLTASHNPKEYNGYKAYWADGGQLVAPHDSNVIEEVKKIESLDDISFDGDSKLITELGQEMDQSYLKMIQNLSLLKKETIASSNLKIVYSSIHGTGITLIPQALNLLGYTNVSTVEEQDNPDGNFPTVVYPNPEEKEAMTLALKKGESVHADLIMATDPDADRVGIAVKNSNDVYQLLNGNQAASLLIYYLLHQWKNKGLKGNEFIAKTIVTTELLSAIASEFGVPCYDTLTGFKFIADLILKLEGKEVFIGGGEESYGYMIGDKVRDKDAVASSVMLAEMAAWAKSNGKTVFDLLIDIYEKFGVYYEELKSVTKKGLSGASEIQQMMDQFRNNPPKTLAGSPINFIIDYRSGIKKSVDGNEEVIELPSSNVLQYLTEDGTKVSIRPSGTEPKIKFYFAVRGDLNGQDYFTIEKELKNKVHNLLKDLNL